MRGISRANNNNELQGILSKQSNITDAPRKLDDNELAKAFHDKVMKSKCPKLQCDLGDMYFKDENYANAIEWYTKAADQSIEEETKSIITQFHNDMQTYKNNPSSKLNYPDIDTVQRQLLNDEKYQPVARAKHQLGLIYKAQNKQAEAWKYLEEASLSMLYTPAILACGLMLEDGTANNSNLEEASLSMLYTPAILACGLMLEDGTANNSSLDSAQRAAEAWYRTFGKSKTTPCNPFPKGKYSESASQSAFQYHLANELNSAWAQVTLGEMYSYQLIEGLHDERTPWQSVIHWFTKAAEQGDRYGQRELAYQLLYAGRDVGAAKRWYRLAAEQGSISSGKKLVSLGSTQLDNLPIALLKETLTWGTAELVSLVDIKQQLSDTTATKLLNILLNNDSKTQEKPDLLPTDRNTFIVLMTKLLKTNVTQDQIKFLKTCIEAQIKTPSHYRPDSYSSILWHKQGTQPGPYQPLLDKISTREKTSSPTFVEMTNIAPSTSIMA
jgi:TPR repeat protein